MTEKLTKTIASAGLFVGGIFGMAGSVVSSSSLRNLAWGLDGVGLVLAGALLTIFYFRKGYDTVAAGFLIFAIGESLIMASNTAELNENISSFGAGASLWAASLALISFENVFPKLIRLTGFISAVLFSVVSVQILMGDPINALSQPLPFYAYPFFAATILGWGWALLKTRSF